MMKFSNTKNQYCSMALITLLLAFAEQLIAAPGPDESGVTALEEIVVTANKRGAQSLQDTAGSIQAISAQTLERVLVEGFEDYIKMVPGLTSVSSGTGQSQIVIRGVNATRVTSNNAQTRALAGLYIDEMPISLTGFNPDLGVVDVERIEVLRGPQGTLYGASSMSGTIRLITAKPDTEEVSGSMNVDGSLTKGGDGNWGVKGWTNLPLSDRVAARISAYTSEKGGVIDNVEPGNIEEDYNSEDTYGGRVQVAYYGDRLDASASFMFNDLQTNGRPQEFAQNTGDPRLAEITDNLQTSKFFNDSFDSRFLGLSFTLDYDFDNINVVSTSSASDVDMKNRLDDTFRVLALTPIPAPFSDLRDNTRYRTKIQEIRVSSTYDSPLQWIVGGYYEANRKKYTQTQFTPGTNAFFEFLTSIGAFPPNLCGTLVSTCFGASEDSVFDSTESIKTDQVAVFGEATYSFTDQFRLKIGFRWFDYESDVDNRAAGPANSGVTRLTDTVKESDWVPKVELSYDISEDHMVYATYSEGFRLGGVNGFIPPATTIPCGPQLAELGSSVGSPFLSDSIKNYEIGAKTSWMNNRLTANLAVYRNVFDDIQSSIVLDCGFTQNFNAGTLENIGFEADIAYKASEALSLNVGLAYVDSEITTPVPGLNSDGDEPPYVPEFSATGSIEYGVPVWNGFGFIRGDVRHVGSSGNEFSSVPTVMKLDSYTVVDLTMGYEYDSWGLSLYARNLFDETVVTNIDPDRVQPSQFTRGRTRTVGLSISKSF